MKPEYGKWEQVAYCKHCITEMSDRDMFYSDGCCPYCGEQSRGTIVDAIYDSRRFVRTIPKLMFWVQPQGFWEYKNKVKEKHDKEKKDKKG